MADDLEANLTTVESPLLRVHPRKRWRKVAGAAIFIAFTLSRSTHVQECPELEMTPVLPNNPRYRLRMAFITLRGMAAFSRAADALPPDNRNELSDAFFGSTSRSGTVITVEQDGLSGLVRSQNFEQLRQLGGVKGVASALETDTDSGIKGNDKSIVAERRKMYGSNGVEKPAPEIQQVVWETIKDPIIIYLLLCAVLSLGFGITKHRLKGWSDGGGIFAAVFVVVAVIAYCKIWSRRQIFELAGAGKYFTIAVKRNGETRQISVCDVVVGDVISLNLGDRIPADGLYIHGDSLQVEEPKITENLGPRKLKDRNDPFLLSGSKVTRGSAQMLVTAVGANESAAQWQMLSKHCDDANQKTPLEKKLHKVAMAIARVGFVVAFLVLVVLLIRYFTGNMQDDNGKPEFIAGKTRIHYVCFAVIGILATPFVIASTAIPEGLLLAVIIPIAYSTNKMAAAQKALVRNVSAWEEIGSTTVICTNERGNLQELIVSRFWHGEETFSLIAPNVREQLLRGVVSDSTEVSPGSSTESIGRAIQKWAFHPVIEDAEQISATCKFLHQKGDPEGILVKCSQYYDRDGNIKKITNEVRESLEQIILKMKSEFPQCLGFSCSTENFHPQQKEKCFTLIGVAGLTYKCPPEIKEAVTDCQRAGVNIKLVTRSELSAARVIAFECGILDRNDDQTTGQVVEGIEFQNYPKEERLEKSDKIRVMARASTLDRNLLVEDLIDKGHVVAVTGDSVGDATVLKEATIGLSVLGIEGTNKTKESSDIIILDNSFESIAKALGWGRCMYWKIQKYTQFQLTVIVSSLVIDFVTAISASEPPNIKIVATISSGKAPFAALQVLWAKLIVGILAALAITREEPKEKLHQLPFGKKTEQFITSILWKNIVGEALYSIIVLLTINFKGKSVLNMDPKVKDTMIFNIFVLWQLFLILTTKRFEINIIRWIQREKIFWSIVVSIFLLQLVFVEVLEKFAGTKRLNLMQWVACFGLASLAWPIGWLVNRTNFPRCLSYI